MSKDRPFSFDDLEDKPGPEIKCLNCGDIIQSKHRHDFQACSCFKNEVDNKGIAIDGGGTYIRLLGNIFDGYEFVDKECEWAKGEAINATK